MTAAPLLAAMVAAALLTAGCTDDSESAAPPSPPPASSPASPTPSPTPAPVQGEVSVETTSVSPAGNRLYPRGSAQDSMSPDRRAIRTFARQVTGWLDDHLNAIQRGEGPGKLAGSPLLKGASSVVARGVTTGLAPTGTTIDSARYRIEVAVDGGPQWAHVEAVVVDSAGTEHRAAFVFAAHPQGPRLVAAGPVRKDDA